MSQRSARLITSLTLTASTLVPVSLAQASAASAVDACPIEIVDEANMYYETMPQVQRAVDALEAKGADVRIRTMHGFAPFSSLDDYLGNMRWLCRGNWSSDDGKLTKGNLVVLGISFYPNDSQRSVKLFYGSDWREPLEGNGAAERIETSIIGPRLWEGDYAGATIAGLEAVGEEIDAYVNPDSYEGDTVREAFDTSVIWRAVKLLAIALGVTSLVIGAHIVYEKRRSHRVKLRRSKVTALEAKNAAETLYRSIDNEQRNAERELMLSELMQADAATARKAKRLSDAYVEAKEEAENSLLLVIWPTEPATHIDQCDSLATQYNDAYLAGLKAKRLDNEITGQYKKLRGMSA